MRRPWREWVVVDVRLVAAFAVGFGVAVVEATMVARLRMTTCRCRLCRVLVVVGSCRKLRVGRVERVWIPAVETRWIRVR